MELEPLILSIREEVGKILKKRDLTLIDEFLDRDELHLTIEFICDRLFTQNFVISEFLGEMLKEISEKFEISPIRSWCPLLVEEAESHQLKRLWGDFPDFETPAMEIFNKVRPSIDPEAAAQIDEFFSVGELSLALDGLFYRLINDKIPISKKDVDQLRSIWHDLSHDPTEWIGFNIQ
jgi:hypothetical protein